MSAANSKTFFKNLKDTVKKIDSDSAKVKEKLYSSFADDHLAAKKSSELNDKINAMRKEADILKHSLQPKLSHTGDFCHDFTELILEIEDAVSKQEKYLKTFGYVPVNDIPESTPLPAHDSEPSENPTTPNEKGKEKMSIETTPDILDYGMSSRNFAEKHANGTEINRKSSVEDLIIPKRTVFGGELKDVENGLSLKSPVLEGLQTETNEMTPTAPAGSISSSYTSSILPKTPTLDLTSVVGDYGNRQ